MDKPSFCLMNIEKICDYGFETVDLNAVCCDICHKDTEEELVECNLSQDSIPKQENDSLTNDEDQTLSSLAHKQCLARWTDIVKRNHIIRKKAMEKTKQYKGYSNDSITTKSIIKCENSQHSKQLRLDLNSANSTIDKNTLIEMDSEKLEELIAQMKERIRGMSTQLINELQQRDDLQLEISHQNEIIAELIKSERSNESNGKCSKASPLRMSLHPLSI